MMIVDDVNHSTIEQPYHITMSSKPSPRKIGWLWIMAKSWESVAEELTVLLYLAVNLTTTLHDLVPNKRIIPLNLESLLASNILPFCL